MNREKIIRMAREAGISIIEDKDLDARSYLCHEFEFECFAILFENAVREKCAEDALNTPVKSHNQDLREACANTILAKRRNKMNAKESQTNELREADGVRLLNNLNQYLIETLKAIAKDDTPTDCTLSATIEYHKSIARAAIAKATGGDK